MKKHTIRIVGGEYRRTPVPVVEAQGLRPTPDRVRETLYNWLHHLWGGNFSDKRVLDLFAGTGVLGLEAASRGAAHIQMVESNPQAVAALRALRVKLDAGNVRIHAGDARTVLQRLVPASFDLILLDPPFGLGVLDGLWPLLASPLAKSGLVYVESENTIQPPGWLETVREGKAGNVRFRLLRFAAPQKMDNNPGKDPE